MLNASRHRISLRDPGKITNILQSGCSTPLGIGYRYAHLSKCTVHLYPGCSTPLGIGYRYATFLKKKNHRATPGAQRLSASDIATLSVSHAGITLSASAQRLSASDIATQRAESRMVDPEKCSTPLGIGYRYALDFLACSKSLLVLNASRHRISLRSLNQSSSRIPDRCSTPLGIGYRYAPPSASGRPLNIEVLNASRHRISLREMLPAS